MKNCTDCKIKLTVSNAVKRSATSYKNKCKPCKNAYESKRTKGKPRLDKIRPKVPCFICNDSCTRRGSLIGFCSLKCRFLFYVPEREEDSCWVWRGIVKKGYGVFCVGKKERRAHRISYELFNGSLEKELFVCHSCDNPSCVNPKHLWKGTNKDNQIDSVNKGRNRYAKLRACMQ